MRLVSAGERMKVESFSFQRTFSFQRSSAHLSSIERTPNHVL